MPFSSLFLLHWYCHYQFFWLSLPVIFSNGSVPLHRKGSFGRFWCFTLLIWLKWYFFSYDISLFSLISLLLLISTLVLAIYWCLNSSMDMADEQARIQSNRMSVVIDAGSYNPVYFRILISWEWTWSFVLDVVDVVTPGCFYFYFD